MRMRTKKKRKLSTNHQEHLGRKQNPFLRFRTLSHHKNRRIRSHHESNVPVRERTNNVHVKNYKLDRTKLRNFRKRNADHYLDDQRIKKISRENTKKDQNCYELQELKVL